MSHVWVYTRSFDGGPGYDVRGVFSTRELAFSAANKDLVLGSRDSLYGDWLDSEGNVTWMHDEECSYTFDRDIRMHELDVTTI